MRLIRSVMVIAGYYLTASTYFGIIFLMGEHYNVESMPRSYVFANLLSHTHCTFSGILYAMTNKRYRDAYKKMFYFCWSRGKVGVELTTTSGDSSSTRTVSGAVTSVTKT